ncbi:MULTISPECIES: endonuclease MutS2 [Fusobacterium]|jgi:DNA mismatch repair protein MutS2|uniref:Endonuclease MutS2 n=1 Tax=Fusobacterium varium ATCC 27725 TaxID=469618 RepID=A0ABM6U2V7_FUSVA|nr:MULTISPECIES: endonuclease MutS2 [Fusobacterium]AVQ30634.1 endonuclease MutS2 [Fusobacterium varium ATCC 27725]EES65304.1 MutS2 family protein [Fusobacterium varium ATCC 27725]MCI6031813.1 endonuclease MutS2 [Fusobacterium varium]MDY4004584.1 endonuclease MutS2 [Fusobacterium varium]RGJ24288.1 endonuclease MutS2 [Fusobacterium varium]
MNRHSYTVLEFDKLREEISNYSAIEENHYKILGLEPFKDFSSLNRELDILRDFTDFLKFDGGLETAGMKDICKMTKKSQLIGTYLDVEDLWDINHNLRLFRVFKNRLDDLNKYKDLRDKFNDVPILRGVEDIINKAIDNNKEIKDDASLDLRDIRIHKKTLAMNIKRKFDELFNEPQFAKVFQEKIITERDGRSVVPVKADFKGQIKGIEHDRSSSGQTVFIEPLSIVALNNKNRELEIKEKEEIRKILLRITDYIRNNKDDIDKVGEAIITLDILNARAMYGIEKKCVVPNINNREILTLIEARHPFIPISSVVPLTFEIGKDYNTLLITGPNTGGKTVALKTAGLLTLMALSGIPIPAHEHSSIGFFTGVYADIGDEQSIEQSLSSFSAHLKNVQEILENVTKASLVLLDELGSGTDPTEGSAFAMAVIDYLKDKKCKSIITTHYSEVKAHGYNEEGIETASMEFNVETLSPTYRLLIGIPGESNALTIARRLGVSEEVINKAKSYISDDNKKIEKMISNIKDKADELDVMKKQVEFLKEAAQRDKEAFEEKLRILEKEKNDILKEAYEKADRMMKEMQSKAAALVEKIQKEDNKKEDIKNVQKSLNMLRSALQSDKSKTVIEKPKVARKVDFKVGERVFVNSLNQFANVLKINLSKETTQVQAGILKLEVSLDDVKVVEEKKQKVYNSFSHKKTAVRSEIDLRGKMVDEAVYELETYLDRAIMNSYNEVYVIHGKGTGALREGILNYLKKCPYVKEYRIGGHGEGGLGCTVVTLK